MSDSDDNSQYFVEDRSCSSSRVIIDIERNNHQSTNEFIFEMIEKEPDIFPVEEIHMGMAGVSDIDSVNDDKSSSSSLVIIDINGNYYQIESDFAAVVKSNKEENINDTEVILNSIRTDAASRIQALFRGARMRVILSNDPRFKEVTNRLGRPGRKPVQNIQHLHIPINVGSTAASRSGDLNDTYCRVYPENSASVPNFSLNSRNIKGGRPSLALTALSPSDTSRKDTAHQRLFTNPAERKRIVGACRALRDQIACFESAFIHFYGRKPKNASERVPLATNYAQYRKWKRVIRADAASRIQTLFRGARMRVLLSNDPQFKEIVTNRLGCNYSRKNISHGSGNRKVPRDDGFSWSSISWSVSRTDSTSTSSSLSFNDASLPELQTRKRKLRQQLKQYDMKFFNQHGRMPVKVEKEPIRHLYENYNALKNHILPHDLAALKTEKQTLHRMLRSYEKDFFNVHSRQVSCYADIRPVESQYRRYKDINKQISSIQASLAKKKRDLS